MVFNTGAALLDAIVLAVVSREPEGTYGYRITQDVRRVIDLSESTLYPVLRRLQKDECLEVYDMECAGRNRRYYKVTSRGWAQLQLYESEWRQYAEKVTGLFEGRPDRGRMQEEPEQTQQRQSRAEQAQQGESRAEQTQQRENRAGTDADSTGSDRKKQAETEGTGR